MLTIDVKLIGTTFEARVTNWADNTITETELPVRSKSLHGCIYGIAARLEEFANEQLGEDNPC